MDVFLIFIAPFLVILAGIVVAFWWVLRDVDIGKEK